MSYLIEGLDSAKFAPLFQLSDADWPNRESVWALRLKERRHAASAYAKRPKAIGCCY